MLDQMIRKIALDLLAEPIRPSSRAKLIEAFWELQYLNRFGLLKVPDLALLKASRLGLDPSPSASTGSTVDEDILISQPIDQPESQPVTSDIAAVLGDKSLQLAGAKRLLERLVAAKDSLSQEIRSLEAVPPVNDFKRVTFSVEGIDIAATSQKRNFNKEKVNLAVRQALGLWSAVAPVDFQSPIAGEKPAVRIHFVKDGKKSSEVGLTGGSILNGGSATISMDCDNQLFIDRYLEADQFPAIPSFDLIGYLGHEVGHALGLDHVPGGLMQASLDTGVFRRLFPSDIREVQQLHGALHLATTAKANLADTAQLIDASPGIVLQKGTFGLVVFGPMETKTLLDVLVPAKGMVANALRLKYTTVTANVFVNQVETFDGLIPIQRFAVSSRSSITDGLAGKRSNLQFGFMPRRPMRNDMLVRMEIHFTKQGGQRESDFGVVQVGEVSVETIT